MATIKVDIGTVRLRTKIQRAVKITSAKRVSEETERSIAEWMSFNFRVSGAERKWPRLARSTQVVGKKQKPFRKTSWTKAFLSSNPARSLKTLFTIRRKGYTVHFRPKTKILVFAHAGTRPHLITPKRGQFLKFQMAPGTGALQPEARLQGSGASGTVTVFSKGIQHPGQPPRPLMPTARIAKLEITEGVTEYLRKELRRL